MPQPSEGGVIHPAQSLWAHLRDQQLLSQAVVALSAAPRLVHLCLDGPVPLQPSALRSMGQSLRELVFHGEMRTPDLHELLDHVGALHNLRMLAINNLLQPPPPEVDFTELTTLPYLASLTLLMSEHSWSFRISAAQVQCLCVCSRLEFVDAGIWSPDEREVDDLPSAAPQIAEGIAMLVTAVLARPGMALAAGCDAVALRHLQHGGTVMPHPRSGGTCPSSTDLRRLSLRMDPHLPWQSSELAHRRLHRAARSGCAGRGPCRRASRSGIQCR